MECSPEFQSRGEPRPPAQPPGSTDFSLCPEHFTPRAKPREFALTLLSCAAGLAPCPLISSQIRATPITSDNWDKAKGTDI